jgi:hypothetical protein
MGSLQRIAVGCLALLAAGGAAQAENWQTAKQADGITVALSEVPGSDYKAYRGTVLINASVAKVRALQEDAATACQWIYECKRQKLLKSQGDQAWTYTQFNTPWPVTARDSVLHITNVIGTDGTVVRNLEGVPDFVPPEKGFVRVTQVKGFWKLEPKGPTQTAVTYQVHTEPGGSVPSFVANKFVVDAPFNTLKALKEKAERP